MDVLNPRSWMKKREGNFGVNPGRSKARHRQTRLGESTSVVLRVACRLHLQAAVTLVRVGAMCAYTNGCCNPSWGILVAEVS